MTAGQRFVVIAAVVILGAIIAGVIFTSHAPEANQTLLVGAVLEAAKDPRRQTPIADARITATTIDGSAVAKSDASGQFHLILSPAVKPDQALTLKVRHPGYQPFEITQLVKDQIYIARLLPVHAEPTVDAATSELAIGDLRVRYSVKVSATNNVGSFARTFEVPGSGGVPCGGTAGCSPDGRWKASRNSVAYDAGEGNEFREVRVSCIAGPCSFSTIERGNFLNPGRTLKLTVLNWSDTATFLVEAEVTRTQINDIVRYSIPVVFGKAMNFALPGTAEGPSVEADLNGSDIVFPLGPKLFLSWAACTLKTDADGSKLYHCELKPGYRFR